LGVAGQDRYTENQRADYSLTFRGLGHGLYYIAHHFCSAHRMNIKNAHSQPRSLDSRHRYSVRDVVEFQVQKYSLIHRDDLSHDVWTRSGEELLAHFEDPRDAAQPLD